MFVSRLSRFPRKPFAELDYARHMPKEYIDRVKRTVPKKTFDGRFGAPAITQWTLHPEDYEPSHLRPWQDKQITHHMEKADKYFQKNLYKKHYELARSRVQRIPDEQWTFFPGDLVQVLVGKDKGRQGTVMQVSRETNEVLVEGLHCKLEEEMEGGEKMGIERSVRWKEQPLCVDKQQVMLVDPNDNDPCDAKWDLVGDDYVRVSARSGFEIPIPSQASVTYEYLQADKYIEVEGKDTPSSVVLERTYVPKLMSFEQEIQQEMGIQDDRKPAPTYWY